MILEHDLGPVHPGGGGHRVVGVGHHQEGEVGRAEVGGQPEPDLRSTVGGDGARGDEAQRRDRLVELRIPDGIQGGKHPRYLDH